MTKVCWLMVRDRSSVSSPHSSHLFYLIYSYLISCCNPHAPHSSSPHLKRLPSFLDVFLICPTFVGVQLMTLCWATTLTRPRHRRLRTFSPRSRRKTKWLLFKKKTKSEVVVKEELFIFLSFTPLVNPSVKQSSSHTNKHFITYRLELIHKFDGSHQRTVWGCEMCDMA